MTCGNCEALRDRVRILERELGHRRREGAIGSLMHRLDLEPIQARLVLDMYEAKGRAVAVDRLVENSGSSSADAVKTQICRMRSVMGKAAFDTHERLGYGLSVVGMSMVLAALEPPELQDARA